MNQAIRIHENGGPEVLRLEETKVDPPGYGEVLIRHTAVGGDDPRHGRAGPPHGGVGRYAPHRR